MVADWEPIAAPLEQLTCPEVGEPVASTSSPRFPPSLNLIAKSLPASPLDGGELHEKGQTTLYVLVRLLVLPALSAAFTV